MKVGFLFPNSEVSRNLAARLLESNIEVEFFCPDKLDVEVAQNIIFEMNILGRELENNECRFREVVKKIKKKQIVYFTNIFVWEMNSAKMLKCVVCSAIKDLILTSRKD